MRGFLITLIEIINGTGSLVGTLVSRQPILGQKAYMKNYNISLLFNLVLLRRKLTSNLRPYGGRTICQLFVKFGTKFASLQISQCSWVVNSINK